MAKRKAAPGKYVLVSANDQGGRRFVLFVKGETTVNPLGFRDAEEVRRFMTDAAMEAVASTGLSLKVIAPGALDISSWDGKEDRESIEFPGCPQCGFVLTLVPDDVWAAGVPLRGGH